MQFECEENTQFDEVVHKQWHIEDHYIFLCKGRSFEILTSLKVKL